MMLGGMVKKRNGITPKSAGFEGRGSSFYIQNCD
jgi:hypothetical protein